MEQLRAAHERWSIARALVVQAALTLSRNFDDASARGELKSALEAERRTRLEFERALRADEPPPPRSSQA